MKVTKVEKADVFSPEEVAVREALVEDLVNAERVTGKSSGFEFIAAVAASACMFDGAAQPVEVVMKMSADDFLSLSDALGLSESATSQSESST